MPKGVLWRQADIFVASLGGRAGANEWESLDAIVEAAKNGGSKVLPAPPFMHGAGHWVALSAFTGGNTVVHPGRRDRPRRRRHLAHDRAREGQRCC